MKIQQRVFLIAFCSPLETFQKGTLKAVRRRLLASHRLHSEAAFISPSTDLQVEVEAAGLRVAVGVTLQRHVIVLDDGSLRQDLEADLLRRI